MSEAQNNYPFTHDQDYWQRRLHESATILLELERKVREARQKLVETREAAVADGYEVTQLNATEFMLIPFNLPF